MKALRFSIVVPTYNEEQDIAETLKALERLEYPDFEVIVVDDHSQDRTIEIVESFTRRLPNFQCLRQPQNQGAAMARNRGIRESTGEILVILNADVLLPPDFLRKISPYYQEGKQWVAVRSEVKNQETVYARYIEAGYQNLIQNHPWVWSEGFSCTKSAAVQVGLFPETMPGCYGEDVDFGINLEKFFSGVKALDIVVQHFVPDRLLSFWRQRVTWGKGRTHYYYYLKQYSFFSLILNSLFSTLYRIIKLFFGFPVRRAWKLFRYSRKGEKDFFPFLGVEWVQEAAMIVGIWKACFSVAKKGLLRKIQELL